MRRLRFLTTPGSNGFMTELLEGVAAAVTREGIDAAVSADGFPPHEDATAYVVIPHEYFDTATSGGPATERHLQRTIGLCVEQPGTPWFERTARHARRLGALADIREAGAAELRRRGLAAERIRLGYLPEWDRWHRDLATERSIDLLFMGSLDDRRARLLAGYGETLWRRRARLLTPSEAPRTAPAPDFLMGAEKHDLLRRSHALLNVHREGARGLELLRVLESISNGCVVVSEHSADGAPLVAGEHYVASAADRLAVVADLLLDDPQRLAAIRLAAYDFVRAELTMRPAALRLIELADALTSRRVRYRGRRLEPVAPPPQPAEPVPDGAGQPPDLAVLRAGLKRVAVDVLELRRAAAPLVGAAAGPAPIVQTPAYTSVEPRASVCITVHDYEREVEEALASALALEEVEFEVVVIDDASTDASRARVAEFAEAHPYLPLVLLEQDVNAGLGRSRNLAARHARADLVLTLDADNRVYPNALARLVAAMDADPSAAFAYGTLAVHDGHAPVDLLSCRPWEPAKLLHANYIDAFALIRRAALDLVGGYATDPRLHGYEDYDLWCRFAERGLHGVHVPEIVGRYRRSQHSMIGLTTLDDTVARSLMRSRAPGLWAAEALAVAERA